MILVIYFLLVWDVCVFVCVAGKVWVTREQLLNEYGVSFGVMNTVWNQR